MNYRAYIYGLLAAAGCGAPLPGTPSTVSEFAADTHAADTDAADTDISTESKNATGISDTTSSPQESTLPSLAASTAPGPPPRPLEDSALTAAPEQCKRRDFSGWTDPRHRIRVLSKISDLKISPVDKAAAVRRAVNQSEHFFDKCQLICPALTVPIEVRMLLSPNGLPVQVETSGTLNEELLSCVKTQARLLKVSDVDLAHPVSLSFVVTLKEPTVRRIAPPSPQ